MYRFIAFTTLLLLHFFSMADPSAPILHFSRVEKDKGLAGNWHRSICQDNTGMVWVSANDGVVRHDGMSFHRFKYDISDSTSVDGQVNDIYIDPQGTIWLATQVGIQTFSADDERFESIHLKDTRGNKLFSNITSINAYGEDSLLLMGAHDGPIIFNTKTQQPEYLRHTLMRQLLPAEAEYRATCVDSENNMLFSTKNDGIYYWDNALLRGIHLFPQAEDVNAISIDSYGRFWFRSNNNLNIYDTRTKKTTTFKYQFTNGTKQKNDINALCFYKGKLFVGTASDGLYVVDTSSHETFRYTNSPSDSFSVPDNNIASLYKDRADNLWIGTGGNGLAILKHTQKKFKRDKIFQYCDFSRCNFVNAIVVSKEETLWVGMDGGGLNYRRKNQSEFSSMLSFSGENIYCITSLADGQGDCIWVGTFDRGLFKLDYRGKVLTHISTSVASASGDKLPSNFIESLLVASDGKIWIGANNGGVALYDEKTGTLKRIAPDPKKPTTTISSPDATSFYEDSQNRIWITTYWGLNLFDKDGNYVQKWINDEYLFSNISSNTVNRIVEDTAGIFWIATGYGINYFRYSDAKFSLLCENNGLVNNSVNRIEVDKNGDIWASTNDGLSKYDRKQNRFYNFHEQNGLASTAFRKASFADVDGTLYFGSENGIVSFNPEQIETDTAEIKTLITEFKLFNKKIYPQDGTVLPKSIFNLSEISLSATQNYIGFEFSALSFVDFKKLKFKYRLIGADQDWVETDATKRYADYSNLSPGKYIFQVASTNNDGVWGTDFAQIKITIIPPFYKTPIFRFIIISTLLLCIFFAMRWREQKLSLYKDRLEKAIEERTSIIAAKNDEINEQNQRLLVLNNTKDRFFSIIAHDLKNPLNALMGFSGLLNDKYEDLPDAKKKRFIGVINESSRSMYGLLINLLDWSRSQTGNLRFEPAVYNLQPIVEESIILISSQAEHKGVRLINQITFNHKIVADINMLKTVLRNLLTNAIKFSFRSDSVTIGISDIENGLVTIFIKDSGIGMSDEQLTHLFNNNAGTTKLGTEQEQGSGLGLIICKEFIERNKGNVRCMSQKGKGTTIFFTVPLAP